MNPVDVPPLEERSLGEVHLSEQLVAVTAKRSMASQSRCNANACSQFDSSGSHRQTDGKWHDAT